MSVAASRSRNLSTDLQADDSERRQLWDAHRRFAVKIQERSALMRSLMLIAAHGVYIRFDDSQTRINDGRFVQLQLNYSDRTFRSMLEHIEDRAEEIANGEDLITSYQPGATPEGDGDEDLDRAARIHQEQKLRTERIERARRSLARVPESLRKDYTTELFELLSYEADNPLRKMLERRFLEGGDWIGTDPAAYLRHWGDQVKAANALHARYLAEEAVA